MDHQKVYDAIILKAKSENRIKETYYNRKKSNFSLAYYENHHIIPRCMNGNNDSSNMVLLTAREHYICHKLLTYIYPTNRKIICAFFYMTNSKKNKHIKSARDFSYAKELISTIAIPEHQKIKQRNLMLGKIPWNKGKKNIYSEDVIKTQSEKRKKWIEEHKNDPNYIKKIEKLKKCNLGKHFSEETKKKMSLNHFNCEGENNGMFGKKHKLESLKKMSLSVKNRKKIKCEYCGKELNKLNYIKWHGENCKYKDL